MTLATIVAFKKHVILDTIEICSGLGFVLLGITTIGTPEVVQIVAFSFKLRQPGRHIINKF